MRKNHYTQILLLCSAAMLTVACQRESLTTPGTDILTAVIEGVDTKTAYDTAEGKFAWSAGDQIAICYSDGTYTDYEVRTDGAVSALSTGTRTRAHYALYPSTIAVAGQYGDTDLIINLPDTYDISSIVAREEGHPGDDFSPMPLVAVNSESSRLLDFRHVGGMVRIILEGVLPETQRVRVSFDKDVTGAYTVDTTAPAAPCITTAGSATHNTVSFIIAETAVGSVENPIVLNVPVPCGTYGSVSVETLDVSGAVLAARVFDDAVLTFSRHHGKVLNFSELTVDFVLGSLSDASVDYLGGAVSLSSAFTSYRTSNGGITRNAVPFRLEYSEDDGATWSETPPSWLTLGTIDYQGSASGQAVTFTASEQINSVVDDYHTELSKPGRAKTDFDLSTYHVATGATVARTTANCYVVQGSGTYRFPLVYGNGVKDGEPNEGAYRAKAGPDAADYRPDDGIRNYLGRFKDHLDQNIMSPYIATQQSGKALTATLVWEDVPGLVTDVALSGSGEDSYLTFRVPAENITQGNALVAVLADGVIAWSWHIWVTDEDMTATKEGSNGYLFAPVNIGWCEAKLTELHEGRSCLVRATQTLSGKTTEARVSQTAHSVILGENNLYYEWGRKDPVRAATLRAGANSGDNKIYYPSSSGYAPLLAAAGKKTIGQAIQTPYIRYNRGSTANSDWCSVTYYNTWNSVMDGGDLQFATPVTKTIYDPSPVGFKMPPQVAYSDFDWADFEQISNYEVMYRPSGLIFPLTGIRPTDGLLNGVGTGYYWSAVPRVMNYGYYLSVSRSGLILNSIQGRENALSVRPVQE